MTEADNYVSPKRQRSIDAILAALPGSKTEVSERSGVSFKTVMAVMPSLHAAGKIHISEWRRHPVRGPTIAIYSAGRGTDVADTLPRLTKKQVYARFEKRLKGTDRYDLRAAKSRSRHWEKKAIAAPKGWAAMLFIKSKEGAAC